jgi:hypothetical protein
MDEMETLQVLNKIKNKDTEAENLIVLSSGVVLRGKKASSSVLIEVITSSKRPKPPVWRNEKMGRMMENPDDPDYIEQVQAYKYEQAGSLVTAMIMLGTEIYSVPEGMEGPHPYYPGMGGASSTASTPPLSASKSNKKKKVEIEEKLVWPRWVGDYELLRLPMNPENESWRYLTWVKFKAAPTEDDLKLIQEVVGRLSGVRESDAKAAEEFSGSN